MKVFTAPISEQIWDMKYRYKDPQGNPLDKEVEDTWWRIAKHLASCEKEPAKWEKEFYQALEGFKFLPAGRIMAGAGTGRTVTLFNCFVMGIIPDSLKGIFNGLTEAALTMQQGGGIGYDFSPIRPKGSFVKGVASDASGPLSFMDCWDSMCRTIKSAGARRGAMMATLRCDHPDIFEFINAKKDPLRLRMFNVSVLITDKFMDAIEKDLDWDLVFEGKVCETVRARHLWDTIMDSTYNTAEPGCIFIDRINQKNNLRYCETITCTNPCGEQPLPPYGACLLGSINLASLVKKPFTEEAKLDENELASLVSVAVRMMDNVVDVSNFPLEAQRQEAKEKRRLGLGVTGLADALAMCGVKYGSAESIELVEKWTATVDECAYLTSANLAEEKGSFPLFDADQLLTEGTHAFTLSGHVQQAIREKGLRNGLLTSIAPTGTISLYAGNVSSGIEPMFAHAYTRAVTAKDGSKFTEEVVDYAVDLYRKMFPREHLPEYFVTAQDLSPADHIKVQAAAQKHVDSSISKTVNCPEDISFQDFCGVYMDAWEMGCKGCTTYRPNDITGSVLAVSEKDESCTYDPETGTRTCDQ